MNTRHLQILIERYRLGIIPLLVLVLAGCASTSQSDDEGKYPLWKVEGKGNTVYLLGSVHLLPESAHPFPEAFNSAYKQADEVVFEISLDEADMMESMMGLMFKAMMTNGKTLEDVVSPETWALLEPRIDELAESFGEMAGGEGAMGMAAGMDVNPEMLKQVLVRMKPWFLGMLLQLGEAQEEGGYRADLGVDMFYTQKAREDGKKISGLETVSEQVGFLESLTGDAGEEFLLSSLRSTGQGADELDAMVDAWKKGDMNKLDQLVNGSMKDAPETYDRLIVQRNRNWIPQIEKFLKNDKNYLVVVGAGHLVGKDSVVELLRQKGYKVQRM